ncbi:NAC domain-containing protein 104-like [Nymphaea colorata]|nr:NAC domain-containing protein 104-like [Nymphaea colorata]
MAASGIGFPPGLKFYPTDKDLVLHYLYRKVTLPSGEPEFIAEIDLHKYDPWELPGEALGGGREWYFYSRRQRSQRKNSIEYQTAASGYWMVTEMEEPILNGGKTVGHKRSLVFCTGKAPLGTRTSWVMDEYRLADSMIKGSKKRGASKSVSGDWVLCRIHERDVETDSSYGDDGRELSCLDEIFVSLDDLDEISLPCSSSDRFIQ